MVDDADLTELMGTSSARVTTFTWMLGCSFAALSGVLLAPFLGVDAVLLTLLVIQAFGAAAVGRLVSLPLTYVGASASASASRCSTKCVAARPGLAGLPTSLPFIVLFAVLVFSRKGSFAELTTQAVRVAGGARARLTQARSRRFPVRLLAVMVARRRACSRPSSTAPGSSPPPRRWPSCWSSPASACSSACPARCRCATPSSWSFGATTLSHFQDGRHPLPAGPAAGRARPRAGRGAGGHPRHPPLGAVPGPGHLRVRRAGPEPALRHQVRLRHQGPADVDRPELFGISFSGDKAFYYFVLAVVVAGVVAIEVVRVTRLGRILRALADSPTATESLGVNPTASRVLVFCLTAFLAAVAGGLLGSLTQVVNPTSFDFSQSLFWVAVLVTAGPATLGGAILSAVLLVRCRPSSPPAVIEWQPVAFGVVAIVLAQAPNGLAGLFRLPDFSALAGASAWRRRTAGSRLGERVAARRLRGTMAGAS